MKMWPLFVNIDMTISFKNFGCVEYLRFIIHTLLQLFCRIAVILSHSSTEPRRFHNSTCGQRWFLVPIKGGM